MPDNRIISKSKYVVKSVNNTTVHNRLSQRPYTRTPNSPSKRQHNSDSFDDTLNTASSQNSTNDDTRSFSNDLDNTIRLKSEENSRLVQARFKQKISKHSNIQESAAEREFHNKLSQAMTVKVDASLLSKKVELLNSLKNESSN